MLTSSDANEVTCYTNVLGRSDNDAWMRFIWQNVFQVLFLFYIAGFEISSYPLNIALLFIWGQFERYNGYMLRK